jgi:hypothetical protein
MFITIDVTCLPTSFEVSRCLLPSTERSADRFDLDQAKAFSIGTRWSDRDA